MRLDGSASVKHWYVWVCLTIVSSLSYGCLKFCWTVWQGFQVHDCTTPAIPLPPGGGIPSLNDVHIVYTADADAFGGLLGSMVSLASHLSEPQQTWIHLIVPQESVRAAEGLEACFIDLLHPKAAPHMKVHGLRPNPLTTDSMTYARFDLDQYLPDVPRAIYLDADTIVRVDITLLYRMNMTSTLAAAPTAPYLFQRLLCDFVACNEKGLYGNLSARTYFNAGVLLIDMQRWRAEHRGQRLLGWLPRTGGWMKDQLALNLEFQDGIDVLDRRWNWNMVGGSVEYGVRVRDPQRCLADAWILHWSCARIKPWSSGGSLGPDYNLFEPWNFCNRCKGLCDASNHFPDHSKPKTPKSKLPFVHQRFGVQAACRLKNMVPVIRDFAVPGLCDAIEADVASLASSLEATVPFHGVPSVGRDEGATHDSHGAKYEGWPLKIRQSLGAWQDVSNKTSAMIFDTVNVTALVGVSPLSA